MILFWFGFVVLFFHLTKGVFYLIKGVVNVITPFLTKRNRIKKTPEYKVFCKKIDLEFNNPPSKKQYT